MVICAVGTCNSRSGRDKRIAFFSFPKKLDLRRIWILKCQRKYFSPTTHSKVCEKHFTESDFVLSCSFAKSLGYEKTLRLQLKPEAIPTVIPEFKKTVKLKTKSPRKSKALEKRRQIEVCIMFCNHCNCIC